MQGTGRDAVKKIARRAMVAAGALLLVAASPAPAGIGTPRYPDLRAMSPTELQLRTRVVTGVTRYQIRFTTTLWNAGEGALELNRTPHVPADGQADVAQRIYETPVGFTDRPVMTLPYAPGQRFDVPRAARYEIWDERSFKRASARKFIRDQPLYANDSLVYCYADSRRVNPDDSSPSVYSCKQVQQGLSVGWADRYSWLDLAQHVDVGTAPLPDGDYVLRNVVDPDNVLYESPDRADPEREGEVANQGFTYFTVINGDIAGV